MLKCLAALLLLTIGGLAACGAGSAAEPAAALPPPAVAPMAPTSGTETAVLAGGCFWGVQGVYQHLKGVKNVLSGYAGGERTSCRLRIRERWQYRATPSRCRSCTTPQQVSYGQILQVFFLGGSRSHAAQPPGTGRRHAVSLGDLLRQRVAEAGRRSLYRAARCKAGVLAGRIVTRVDPLEAFLRRPRTITRTICSIIPISRTSPINDLPKVRNFERLLPALYNTKPVTVAQAAQARARAARGWPRPRRCSRRRCRPRRTRPMAGATVAK